MLLRHGVRWVTAGCLGDRVLRLTHWPGQGSGSSCGYLHCPRSPPALTSVRDRHHATGMFPTYRPKGVGCELIGVSIKMPTFSSKGLRGSTIKAGDMKSELPFLKMEGLRCQGQGLHLRVLNASRWKKGVGTRKSLFGVVRCNRTPLYQTIWEGNVLRTAGWNGIYLVRWDMV